MGLDVFDAIAPGSIPGEGTKISLAKTKKSVWVELTFVLFVLLVLISYHFS